MALETRAGHKDYSGTPLWKKLGIKSGARVVVVGAPTSFAESLGSLPDGVRVSSRGGGSSEVDVAVVFATQMRSLETSADRVAGRLAPDGGLWLAWPKKAARVDNTDLVFENVHAFGLSLGLVDNKSCSIDDVFQAMRFVYRLQDRSAVPPRRR